VTPLAHELWFVEDPPGMDWSFVTEPRTLFYLGIAVAVTDPRLRRLCWAALPRGVR
jgi:hypothetical protein